MFRQFIYLFSLIILVSIQNGCSSDSDSGDGTNNLPDNNKSGLHFSVSVPDITPNDEFICIDFDDPNPPLPMDRSTSNQWELTTEIPNTLAYKYCRNCECQAADEYFEPGEKGWRVFAPKPGDNYDDTVERWRWWSPQLLAIDINTTGYVSTKPANLPRSDFMTGVMFNDYWNNEWNLSIPGTMARIRAHTNATWIEYAPVNNIKQYYPTPLIEFYGPNGTSQTQLEAIIDAAHAEGFKVFINPIPWGLDIEDNSPSSHDAQWWQDFHDQWRSIMMRYVDIANDKGVEMLAYKMWPNIDALNQDEMGRMDTLAIGLLHEIDTAYSGKIAVQAVSYDEDLPDLSVYDDDATDYLMMSIWSYFPWALAKDPDDPGATADPDTNATVLRRHLAVHLDDGSYGNIEAFSTSHSNRPVIFAQVSALSYDGAIVRPADNDELLDPFFVNDDSQYVMDLQEQSDVIEAVFAEGTKRPFIQGAFVFSYFYWSSIDKSINVRGKPAEKVMKKWFGWINQP